jgi:hypothetical protein
MPIRLAQKFDCLVIFAEQSVSVCFPRPIDAEIEADLRSIYELNPGICLKYFDGDSDPDDCNLDYRSNWQEWYFSVIDFYDQKEVAFAIATCLREDHGLRVRVRRAAASEVSVTADYSPA